VTDPQIKTPKVYHVTTAEPIRDDAPARFAEGIHFAFEGLTTSPAQLEGLGCCEALVTIYEGRYHQIKRMFHAVGNRVTALHRVSMGSILLDPALRPGEYRLLTQAEVASV
jgi:16S rRNA pseudouridine516 synthase